MKKLALVPFLLLFIACASKEQIQPKEQTSFERGDFNITNTKSNTQISYKALLDELEKYDIVILGEFHGFKNHHLTELDIIKYLGNKEQISVVFEMLGEDKQKLIDKAKSQKTSITKENLAQNIGWADNWAYEDYKDIVEYAFYSNAIFIAGNLSQADLQLAFDNKIKPLRGKFSTSKQLKKDLKIALNNYHPMKDEVIEAYINAQLHKDRSMALRLLEQKNKAILVAGMYHSSKKLGVPLHLKDLNNKKKVAVISFDAQSTSESEADFVFEFAE